MDPVGIIQILSPREADDLCLVLANHCAQRFLLCTCQKNLFLVLFGRDINGDGLMDYARARLFHLFIFEVNDASPRR